MKLAAVKIFDTDSRQLRPQETIREVFWAVQSSQASYGVVPMENSIYGFVNETLDLLADRDNLFPDILLCEEACLDIHHYLFGHPPPQMRNARSLSGEKELPVDISTPPKAHPLIDLQHVKCIHSHPQALGQCRRFIDGYLNGTERKEESSTSKAAEIVSQEASESVVAICSERAGKRYGLVVLARCIEDREDNCTRFLVISGRKHLANIQQNSLTSDTSYSKHWKTLVSFTVEHQSPGALQKALAVFEANSLNVVSLNSRPSHAQQFQYIWLVEFEGRKETHVPGPVDRALNWLDEAVGKLRYLGSFRDRSKDY